MSTACGFLLFALTACGPRRPPPLAALNEKQPITTRLAPYEALVILLDAGPDDTDQKRYLIFQEEFLKRMREAKLFQQVFFVEEPPRLGVLLKIALAKRKSFRFASDREKILAHAEVIDIKGQKTLAIFDVDGAMIPAAKDAAVPLPDIDLDQQKYRVAIRNISDKIVEYLQSHR